MKRLTISKLSFGVCLYGATLAAAPVAWAHPDAYVIPDNKKSAGNPGPASAAPAAPGSRHKRKLMFHEQTAYGYSGQTRATVGQAAHDHWLDDASALPPPVEIWYLVTRKIVGGNKVFYCVSPRVENPASQTWTKPISVRLLQEGSPNVIAESRIDTPLEPGASREFPLSMKWCVQTDIRSRMPRLIVDTDHGGAHVAAPAGQKN